MARAAHFFKSYPPSTDSTSEAGFVTNAMKVIRLGRKALDELNVPFWISSGTCLGEH